jgi:hypothetical protein
MVCKKFGSGRDMSQYVADAQRWARALVKRECRGWGDIPRAMRRVAGSLDVDFSIIRDLRYRPPKGIDALVHERLEAAYLAMCEQQDELRQHERHITQVKNPIAAALVRAADALARPDD